MSLRQGAIASEQAINRLSRLSVGIPSEQGINREVSARASIGGDRSDRSIPRTVQRGLSWRSSVVVGKKVGRAAMEVAAKQDPTAFVRVATQLVT